MNKPTLRPGMYFLYVLSVFFGIFAIASFEDREYMPVHYYLVILTVVLFAIPTYLYIKDVRLWRKNPDEYTKQVEERKQRQLIQDQKYRDMKNAEAERKKQEEERKKQEHEKKHLPDCPNCGSWNTVRISTASRVASVATVGIASGKIGKQYQCKDCKHMW